MFEYMTNTVKSAPSIYDFFDFHTFSLPTKSDLKLRITTNFDRFKGNYLVAVLLIAFMYLVFNPAVIPLFGLWACFMYFFKTENQVFKCRGKEIKRDHVFKALCVGTVLYLVVFFNVIFALLATTSFGSILILTHMLLFFSKTEEEV